MWHPLLFSHSWSLLLCHRKKLGCFDMVCSWQFHVSFQQILTNRLFDNSVESSRLHELTLIKESRKKIFHRGCPSRNCVTKWWYCFVAPNFTFLVTLNNRFWRVIGRIQVEATPVFLSALPHPFEHLRKTSGTEIKIISGLP